MKDYYYIKLNTWVVPSSTKNPDSRSFLVISFFKRTPDDEEAHELKQISLDYSLLNFSKFTKTLDFNGNFSHVIELSTASDFKTRADDFMIFLENYKSDFPDTTIFYTPFFETKIKIRSDYNQIKIKNKPLYSEKDGPILYENYKHIYSNVFRDYGFEILSSEYFIYRPE